MERDYQSELREDLLELINQLRDDTQYWKVSVIEAAILEIHRLQTQLNIAADYISTTDQFKDKHPQDVLDEITKWDRTTKE